MNRLRSNAGSVSGSTEGPPAAAPSAGARLATRFREISGELPRSSATHVKAPRPGFSEPGGGAVGSAAVLQLDALGRGHAALAIYHHTNSFRLDAVIAQADPDIAERLRMLRARDEVRFANV